MITVEALQKFGADTATGLKRCAGSEPLYLKLVARVASQNEFDKLAEAVNSGDLKSGFEYAHAMKGVLGNLSLTPLYEKMSAITELLRAGAETDYAPLLKEISDLKNELQALCS